MTQEDAVFPATRRKLAGRVCAPPGACHGNTLVVRLPRVAEPDIEQPLAGRFNSLRLHPHLEARLRQDPESAGASLALQALLRRDDFDPSARLELFADLARHFRAKATFPAEAIGGIGDEQYVRNVVDILFRSRAENRRHSLTAQEPA